MTTSDLDRTGPVSPLVRLRALHGEQRLAAEYPVVPGLLAELAQQDDGFAQLSRAGRLLAKLVPEDIAERHPGVVPATVAVTGHGTVDGLTAPLTAELARHGIPLRVRVGDHDLWLRDLQDTTSDLYAPGTELALCLLDAQIVFDELPLPWGTEDVARSVAGRIELLDQLASRYDEHGTGTLVLNTLPLLPQHTQQLVDHRSRTELSIIWREFNIGLLRLAAAHPRLHVVDLEPLIAESGPVRDPRLAAYAKVYLGEEVLARYARQTGHLLRSCAAGPRRSSSWTSTTPSGTASSATTDPTASPPPPPTAVRSSAGSSGWPSRSAVRAYCSPCAARTTASRCWPCSATTPT